MKKQHIPLFFTLLLTLQACTVAAQHSGIVDTASTQSRVEATQMTATFETSISTPDLAETEKPVNLESTPTLDPSLLFEDDFSDPVSGWDTGEFIGGALTYQDDAYMVSSEGVSPETGEAFLMWGSLNDNSFTDLLLNITARQLYAPENNNNGYGIICRRSGEGIGSGYLFLISGDGYYSLQKLMEGVPTFLVPWMQSTIIHTGDATNQMAVSCDGNRLSLSVNGEILFEENDSTFSEGGIALAVISYEESPTVIQFDDLTIHLPE